MRGLLFQNAKIVDPAEHRNEVCDLLVQDGRVAQIGKGLFAPSDTLTIDAEGLTLIPGLIDLHTHLRDPGFTQKEDILTGSAAAAAGGVTTICCMPNTNPTCDSVETVKYMLDKAKDAKSRVLPIGSITKGLAGEELTDMKALAEAGVCGFSDDGVPVKTAPLMQAAMVKAAELDLPIFAHCEEPSLSKNGIVNAGKLADELGMPGIPVSAEDVGTAREIALLMSAPKGTRLHICHVSTKNCADMISAAKQSGFEVTGETCPHYFIFNEEKLRLKDADYRMNPPLRTAKDQMAILYALIDGTLDTISTDHAPHTPEEKSNFYTAPNGVIGTETSFSASYTALVASGLMTLSQLVRRMSLNPARILKMDAGTLKVGSRADLVLIDENEKWTVDVEKLHGKSKNCIFKNRELQSKVKMTVLDGKIVFNEMGE